MVCSEVDCDVVLPSCSDAVLSGSSLPSPLLDFLDAGCDRVDCEHDDAAHCAGDVLLSSLMLLIYLYLGMALMIMS